MSDANEDFYVGYRPRTSATIRARIRPVVISLLLLGPVLAVLLVSAQMDFAAAVFEFGRGTTLVGTLRLTPYPALEIEEAGKKRPYLLVGRGKVGLGAEVEDLVGQRVEARGQRIYRDDQWMLQTRIADIRPVGSSQQAHTAPESLGRHTLVGEIVDSKCYLGVMQPGRGKAHRSCAARCISGGIPPVLLVTDRAGNRRHYLLVGSNGRKLGVELLDRVAEPIEVAGEIVHSGGLWYLRAEPGAFRRLARAAE